MGLAEEKIGEECGVFAWYSKRSKPSKDVPTYLIQSGVALQHRGQESAGISTYNPEGKRPIVTHKDVGLVSRVFEFGNPSRKEEIIEACTGVAGIGHVRYSTSGNKDHDDARDKAQPFERRHGRLWKRFAIAFNGNLANHPELRSELESRHDYWLDTDVDTEVIMHYMALALRGEKTSSGEITKPNLFDVSKILMKKFDGAYNILSLFGDGDMLVLRDPHGFHPLVFGENEEGYAFASESTALEKIGIKNFGDVEPGSVYLVNRFGLTRKQVSPSRRSLCQFEHVYFMKGNSEADGTYVHQTRENLGRELAKKEPLKEKMNKSWVVVPAPWTAVPAAEAYSDELGLKLRLAIEKSDTVRGFINAPEERRRIMSSNYIIHKADVSGNKVVVVDDSLVRGETAHQLMKDIKAAGAKEIHLRLTEPTIKYPCFYGVDFPTRTELMANTVQGNVEEQIAKRLGIESVRFLSIDGLVKGIGLPRKDLCLACLDGNYPTPCGRKRFSELQK